MRFDRRASGEGAQVICRPVNGKIFLECRFFVESDPEAETESAQVRLLLYDAQGKVALECFQRLGEEEPLTSILLQPCLWNGTENPYLYRREAFLYDSGGQQLDRLAGSFPLYWLENRGDSVSLNGKLFEPRGVIYSLPETPSEAERQRLLLEDFQRLLELGANCIWVREKKELTGFLLQLCRRMGFLIGVICPEEPDVAEIAGPEKTVRVRWEEAPLFRSWENALFLPDSGRPTELFYRYKARWNREPFVYIVPDSVRRLKSGNYEACVYSSCRKVALYTDGLLFEFQSGQEKFLFREIPAKAPCIMLLAEGEGCSQALSVHKTFTKLTLLGDI